MNVRTLRKNLAKVLDEAQTSPQTIERNGTVYTLSLQSSVHITLKPPKRVHIVEELKQTKPDWKPCKHGADPMMCRYAKPGKPCPTK